MIGRLGSLFSAATCLALTLSAASGRAQDRHTHGFARDDDGASMLVERNPNGGLTTRDDLAGFGKRRQWAFSSDASITAQRTTRIRGGGAVTTVTFAPAADYFVRNNLSVGGVVGLTYSKAGESSGARFTVGPRAGYNFEVSRLLSVWPRLGLAYAYTADGSGGVPLENPSGAPTLASDVNGHAFALSVFVPLMVHPAPHFFAGLGPFIDTDLTGDNRATSWGLKLTLGGWVNPRPV